MSTIENSITRRFSLSIEQAATPRLSRQIIISRQHMRSYIMEKIRNRHPLIEGTHPGGRRAIDVGRNVSIAPKPSVGSAEADDWGRRDSSEIANIALDNLDQIPVW